MATATAKTPALPNTQPSNVAQNFSAFNLQIPTSVTGSVGALSSLYSSYNQFQQSNPLLGSLSFAASLPHLRQAFPDTFNPEKYTDQGSKDLITGLNTGGQAATSGLSAYGVYSNLQKGNYLGASTGTQNLVAQGQNLGYIPDFTEGIQNSTGIKPVTYGKGDNQTTGYAPYTTAPIAAYSAFEDFKQKNYVGGALNTAQAGQAGAQIYSAYFPTSQAVSSVSGAVPAAPNVLSATTVNGASAGASASESTLGTIGEIGGYAGMAYNAYNVATNIGKMPADKAALYATGQAQDAAANYMTGGLYGVGKFGLNAISPELGGGVQHIQDEFNKFQAPYAAVTGYEQGKGKGTFGGAVAGFQGEGKLKDYAASLIIPGYGMTKLLAGALGGTFGGKKISVQQDDRWKALEQQGVTGAAERRQQIANKGPNAGFDPVSGKNWNFQTASDRVTDGSDEFREVYGNYKTFGKDWSTYSIEQQRAIVAGVNDAKLYQSKKGDLMITDEEKAKSIRDQVLAGKLKAPPLKTYNAKQPDASKKAPELPAPVAEKSNALDPGRSFGDKVVNLPSTIDPIRLTPDVKIQANLKIGNSPSAGLSKQEFRDIYMHMSKQGILQGARS